MHEYFKPEDKILDVGAGMGAYTVPLFNEGYDVTAIELVKHNLKMIKSKNKDIKAYQGNAIDLSRFKDNSFSVVLLFGPMYHLISNEEKILALKEAKRVCKPNGFIFVAYIMNEYAVITHAFKERSILQDKDKLSDDYHIIPSPTDLYSYVRIEDIDNLNKEVNLDRIKIITPDGPSNYIREYVNKLSEEEFNEFIKYHLSTCERKDILGASAHTLDILKKN
ncbi:MAG: class I SAM-dependent methyltransferase [Bacilli bacterium]|nr:class I SAM-dependent methyltransferase [Bacilli bacterium]